MQKYFGVMSLCRLYASEKGCKYGLSCKFLHDIPSKEESQGKCGQVLKLSDDTQAGIKKAPVEHTEATDARGLDQQLLKGVADLSLVTRSRQGAQLLYVDILNYCTDYFPLTDWNVTRAFGRVKRFVDASRRAGYTLKTFLDDTNISSEAIYKWKNRREDEVRGSKKKVPHGMTSMLGEMFQKCCIEALYSDEADNDDTIAAYAQEHGASILSRDKDMFRYMGATFSVFSEYSISSNCILSITPHPKGADGSFAHPKPRPLPPSLPRTRPRVAHVKDGTYLRGAPSPCVRFTGRNPHGVVAPLRYAARAAAGVVGPVREEWPEWDMAAAAVVWHTSSADTSPDPAMSALLARPDDAVAALFPAECGRPQGGGGGGPAAPDGVPAREWKKHCFCVRSCVYEACAMAGGPSLLDLWLAHDAAYRRSRPRRLGP